MSEAQGDAGFNWSVQIGPEVPGPVQGVVNGTSATFFLSLGFTGQGMAACSTTAGSTWQQIPPDQVFPVTGDNSVQWRVDPQGGGMLKFLIADIA